MQKQKMDSLQGIRAIAFLGIFGSHTGLQCFSPTGVWGVSVFLILSGFLMSWAYLGKGRIQKVSVLENLRFSIGKLRKLYALHIVMLLAALPLLIQQFFQQGPSMSLFWYDTAKVAANALLLQTLVPFSDFYFSLNGVSWYLSLCLFLYFSFPYLLKILESFRSNLDAVFGIVIVFTMQVIFGFLSTQVDVPSWLSNGLPKWFVYICPLSRLGDFFIGCCLGYIFLRSDVNDGSFLKWSVYEVLALVFVALQILLYLNVMPPREDVITVPSLWWLVVQFTASSCMLVYVFAKGRGIVSRLLTMKPVVYLGNISSFTFLIHEVTIRYVRMGVTGALPESTSLDTIFAVSGAIAFVLTMILSIVWKRYAAGGGRRA